MVDFQKLIRREVCRKQKKWIDQLSQISIKPIKLADTWQNGITPGRRMNAHTYHWQYTYQYRECLHNEIPYDLDVYDWDLMEIMLTPTLNFLDSEKIPYFMSGSGGTKSVHVQIFFKPLYECVRSGWKEGRMALWDWILDQAEIPQGQRGHGKREDGINYPYDKSVSNFSDMSQAKVMRDYGGMRRDMNRKTVIEDLPDTREQMYNGHVKFPEKIELWNPQKIIEQELEFDLKLPENCLQCPVEPMWMHQFEEIANVERPPSYPRLCRQCRKYWGSE